MGIRSRVATVVGRLARWGLHDVLHRHASQLPGRIALAIDSDFIASRRHAMRSGSIVVCGTNGKTTTTNLLAATLEAQACRVLCNRDGANMAAGVASALLGRGKADWAVIEADELSTIHIVPQLQPTYLVLLNLFRDQLDRAGEIDHVQDVIVRALAASPETTLVFCGEDPLCMGVAMRAQEAGTKTLAFGVGEDLGLSPDRVPEARFCLKCGSELRYDYHAYAQLGGFACPTCDFAAPALDFWATDVVVGHEEVSFGFSHLADHHAGAPHTDSSHAGFSHPHVSGAEAERIHAKLGGAYMVYNLLAVASLSFLAGVGSGVLQGAIDSYDPSNGRLQHFVVRGREVVLNLAKNPTGLNQNLLLFASDERPRALFVVINDDANDGRDISWIWDVDFERLAQDDAVAAVMAGGHRANDLQVRLKYAGVRASLANSVEGALAMAADLPTECPLYVLTNYSALWPTKDELERMAKGRG